MHQFFQKESIKIIMSSIKNGRSIFILGLVVSGVGAIVSVVLPYLAKLEIDQLVSKGGFSFFLLDFSPFSTFILILSGVFLVSFFDKFFQEVIRDFLREREEIFRHETDIFLYNRITKMEIGHSLSSNFANVLRYVDNKLDDIIKTIVEVPKDTLSIGIRLSGIGGILLIFDWKILCIVVIAGVIQYYVGRLQFGNNTKREYDLKLRDIEQTLWSIPSEIRRNLTELSRNGAVKEILKVFTKNIHKKQELLRPYQKQQVFIGTCAYIVSVVTTISVKIVVGFSVFYGTGSVGLLTMAVLYTGQLSDVISQIFQTIFNLKKIGFNLSFFDEFLKISVPVGSITYRERHNGDVTFQGVSFSYPVSEDIEKPFYEIMKKNLEILKKSGKETWRVTQMEEDLQQFELVQEDRENTSPKILSNFSFSFERGKIYGIVGKNGAGKTTLVNLISGFFRSYEGKILFNCEDIREWTVESFSNIISVISQVPYTYRAYGDSTVRINLLLGVQREVSDTELYELLADFGLDKKIKKTPRGLDSELGKDVEFSGGQNQILSIIRVILQDRPIIVLDEGTNQLDAENEALVMKYLLSKKTGKIILFITHRMNTIARSDEVLCIEGGNIVAHGTPKDLLEQNDNPYARFYRTQILHEEV